MHLSLWTWLRKLIVRCVLVACKHAIRMVVAKNKVQRLW